MRFSFYLGWVGLAWVMIDLAGDSRRFPDGQDTALGILKVLVGRDPSNAPLDVIGGLAEAYLASSVRTPARGRLLDSICSAADSGRPLLARAH